MSLRDEAYLDLQEIMHDTVSGGDSCTITNPDGASSVFQCLSNDIHLSIDPGTGDVITARQATISVLISDLILEGFEGVRGIASKTSRPWTVDIADVNSNSHIFKVTESYPDRTVGLMTLFLELYERAS
jgi:hypothetical protein